MLRIGDVVKPLCACGCGQRSANKHHAVYRQKLREVAARRERDKRARATLVRELEADERNLVWLAFGCHQAHHGQHWRLPLGKLPDSVFAFAAEVLGAGEAFEYLRRRYHGQDVRLDALLEMAA